MEVNYNFFI